MLFPLLVQRRLDVRTVPRVELIEVTADGIDAVAFNAAQMSTGDVADLAWRPLTGGGSESPISPRAVTPRSRSSPTATSTRSAARRATSSASVGHGQVRFAITDALAYFPSTEIVIATRPPRQSNWLERGLIENAKGRFDIPATHLISGYGLVGEAAAA